MLIEIMNLRTDVREYPYDILVDRSGPFGNPYAVKKDKPIDQALNDACNLYDSYFKRSIANDTFHPQFVMALEYLYDQLKDYGRLRLFCWCAPKRCHSETIREYLLNRYEKEMMQ